MNDSLARASRSWYLSRLMWYEWARHEPLVHDVMALASIPTAITDEDDYGENRPDESDHE